MNLKVSRILHAGYVFECDDTQIAFDPIFENPFSRNCHAFPNVKFDRDRIRHLKFSAVFISHYHDDHCSLESLVLLDRQTPIYIFCLHEELFSWIRQLGFTNVCSVDIDRPVFVGAFEIIPRRALDADVDSIFHIKAAGLNVLNVVDSWIDAETLATLALSAPWDLVLWPFQTMREIEILSPRRALAAPKELPSEWLEQLQILKPRYIVPSSCQFQMENWSWYNHAFFPVSYRQFQKEVESILPETSIIRLNPSVSIMLNRNSLEMSAPLGWVHPVGEQDVDYTYNPEIKPPTTAEIARRFAPLTTSQTEQVLDYCRKGLLEKYNSMEPPLDEYFEKSRLWRLSLYDHEGQSANFHYRIQDNRIDISTEHHEPLAWSTEVPISKLYAALELGEALTSMYMRINDLDFDAEIEKEIQSADIVDDPLIRCLFNSAFGAYQLAQLKKLL